MDKQENKIWKIRTIKDYAGAHNHLLIGCVLEINDACIRLHCRSYHFSQELNSPQDVSEGALMVRIIPWQRIEIINELSNSFGYTKAKLTTNDSGMVIVHDGVYACTIGFQPDRRY